MSGRSFAKLGVRLKEILVALVFLVLLVCFVLIPALSKRKKAEDQEKTFVRFIGEDRRIISVYSLPHGYADHRTVRVIADKQVLLELGWWQSLELSLVLESPSCDSQLVLVRSLASSIMGYGTGDSYLLVSHEGSVLFIPMNLWYYYSVSRDSIEFQVDVRRFDSIKSRIAFKFSFDTTIDGKSESINGYLGMRIRSGPDLFEVKLVPIGRSDAENVLKLLDCEIESVSEWAQWVLFQTAEKETSDYITNRGASEKELLLQKIGQYK